MIKMEYEKSKVNSPKNMTLHLLWNQFSIKADLFKL